MGLAGAVLVAASPGQRDRPGCPVPGALGPAIRCASGARRGRESGGPPRPPSWCGPSRLSERGWRGPPAHSPSRAGGCRGAAHVRHILHHRSRRRRGSPVLARVPGGRQLTAAWWRTSPSPGRRQAHGAPHRRTPPGRYNVRPISGPSAGGIGHGDRHLAQRDTAQGAAVLAGRTGAVGGGLLTGRLVHDQHRVPIIEMTGRPRRRDVHQLLAMVQQL